MGIHYVHLLKENTAMSLNIVEKIDDPVRVKNVLISVSDKSGLESFVPRLMAINPEITLFSTGGTFQRLTEIMGDSAKNRLIQVSEYTGQPETQGGLVKTLDFKIYLGLLTETYNESHQADLKRTDAVPIDMAVVNLYPFKEVAAKKETCIEEARSNIDIGGPCMIRAAAKNFIRVASVVSPDSYDSIIAEMTEKQGRLSLASRFQLAKKAFRHTASYDAAIADYLEAQNAGPMKSCYSF